MDSIDSNLLTDINTEWVMNEEHGIVICPCFKFNTNGYIDNFSNFDFYKWQLEGDTLFFKNTRDEKTAYIEYHNDNWVGEYFPTNTKIKLKKFNKAYHDLGLENPHNLQEYLKNTRWRFRSNNGDIISNEVWLCEDGAIRGYNHPNEHFWKVDETGLSFYNIDNEKTTDFGFITSKEAQKIFVGRYTKDNDWIHMLEYLSGESNEYTREVFSTRKLTTTQSVKNKDLLLVTFNSIGTLYNGKDSLWEFYHLPFQLGLDYVRFGESNPCWYVDKQEVILHDLRNIAHSYKRIALVGGSAGGFAAILFGELLARSNQNIEIQTFTINPQTTLNTIDKHYILENFLEPIRPAMLTDFLAQYSELISLDINDYLKVNLKNITHNVYFDNMNPSENYFMNRITNDRFIKNGIAINGGHADSLGAIMATKKIIKSIELLAR